MSEALAEVASRATQAPVVRRVPSKPAPILGLGFIVKVPETICDKKEARIVGHEWAPDSNRLKGNGWCYYLRFKDSVGEAFVADEQEVLKWQQS